MMQSQIFTFSIMCAMSLVYVMGFLMLISFANQVILSIVPAIVYLIIFAVLIFYQTLLYKMRATKKIYVNTIYSNTFEKYYKIFEKFAKRYGIIIVLVSFVIKQIINSKKQISNDVTLWQQVGGLLFPIIILIGVIVIFHLSDELMQGYYLRKYYEQYRLKYNGTTKQWYVEKSKQYKQAKANGEEE